MSKRLPKRKFMHFVVALPEAGSVDEMQAMLDANLEHHRELLFGERSGVDRANYSAWAYTTWLCHFDTHRDAARHVVRWLVSHGHEPDIWSAIALEDAARLRETLDANPRLSRPEHPLFGHAVLELASPDLRPLLLAHGAGDGSIFTALLLGDANRARKMIRASRRAERMARELAS